MTKVGTTVGAFRICALKDICERSTFNKFRDYSYYTYRILKITEAERSQMPLRANLLNCLTALLVHTYLVYDTGNLQTTTCPES